MEEYQIQIFDKVIPKVARRMEFMNRNVIIEDVVEGCYQHYIPQI